MRGVRGGGLCMLYRWGSNSCGFPVFAAELRGLRAGRLSAGVRLVTVLLSVIFLLLWLSESAPAAGALRVMNPVGRWTLSGLLYAGCVVVSVGASVAGAGSISGERERQALSQLLLTRVTPGQFVRQKSAAVLVLSLWPALGCFPLTAACYALGGCDVEGLLAAWLLLLVVGVQLTASAVMCSALISSAAIALGVNWFLWMCLLAMPGILDDLHLLPQWILFAGTSSVLRILPFVHLVSGQRVMLTGEGLSEFVLSCTFPLLLAAAMVFVAGAGVGYFPGRALLNPQSVQEPRKWLKRRWSGLLRRLRVGTAAGSVVTGEQREQRESRELPERDPVRWRELNRNPQARLFPHLMYSVTVVAGVLWLRQQLAPMEFAASLPSMQIAFGLLSVLMVLVCACESLVSERQQKTQDLLWLIPISNRELLSQKLAGADRLLWLLMISNLSLGLCRLVLDPLRRSGLRVGHVLFLLSGLLLLWLLLQVAKWLSVWQSLRSVSLLQALSRSLLAVGVVFVVPVFPLLLELVRLGGNLSVLPSRWWMCCFSPLLVWLSHLTRFLSWRGNTAGLLWLDFVGVLVWGGLLYGLQQFCRREFGSVEGRLDG